MASAGASLLEAARSTSPEEVDAVDQAVETTEPESKPRRRRKPAAAEDQQAEETTAPVVETTTEPEQTAADADPQPEQPEWLKRLETDLGFQNVGDENEARDRLLEFAVREKQERQRIEEDYQRRLRELEYRQVAAASQQVQEKPAEERKPWQPPVAYPEAAARYLVRNEEGVADWKSDTPVEVRAQAEKYVAWRDEMQEVLLNRPDVFFSKILPQFIDEHARKVIEPFYEQKTAQQQVETTLRQFESENADWLFNTDPTTGRPSGTLSRLGQAVDERFRLHMSRGLSAQEAIEYAQFDVQRQTGQSPWVRQTEQTPAAVREQKRAELESRGRNGARSVAPRKGSFTEPEDARPQNGHVSPGRSLMQLAHAEGASLPYAMPN